MAVDLTLAKQHLRVTHSSEDTLIQQYVDAAKAWVESYTCKLLTRRQITQTQEAFDPRIPLFYGPDPASLSIAYTDTAGSPQTIADARVVRDYAYPAVSWPTAQDNTAITLTYTAGYTTTPADLDHAVLLLVGQFYDNREAAGASMAVEALCGPYRSVRV